MAHNSFPTDTDAARTVGLAMALSDMHLPKEEGSTPHLGWTAF
jgi:hypothetical protein